jgi:hypothetical protein
MSMYPAIFFVILLPIIVSIQLYKLIKNQSSKNSTIRAIILFLLGLVAGIIFAKSLIYFEALYYQSSLEAQNYRFAYEILIVFAVFQLIFFIVLVCKKRT